MQGLPQTGALALLQRQQGLGQFGVIHLHLLQGSGHRIEMPGQLPGLGQAVRLQARIELSIGHPLQAAEQLGQYRQATTDRPTDGQQTQNQRQGAEHQQLQQGIPDFVDLVRGVDGNLQLTPVSHLQQQRRLPGTEQMLAEPAVQPAGLALERRLPDLQPLHAHMAQAVGQPLLQARGVAQRGLVQVLDHRFGGLHFTLHVVTGLAQQQRQAGGTHQDKEQADQQIDPPQRRHGLLDHEVAEHALAFQTLGEETEFARFDRHEEDFRLAGILELELGEGDRLDLHATGLDLAQEDRGGEFRRLERVLLLPAGDDLQLIGLAGFQLVLHLRHAVVALCVAQHQIRQRGAATGQVAGGMQIVEADQAANQ
ncbi:hypothetical protein D3C84_534460 [compost metagenome]